MKKLIVSVMMAVAAFSAPAVQAADDDVSVLLGFGSYHYFKRNYNEQNPGIGIKYNTWDVLYIAKNSIEAPSVQVAYNKNFYTVESTGTEFNYRVGLASGYKDGTHWSHYEFEQADLEIGDTGIIPMISVDIHQKLYNNVGAILAISPELLMFGMEIKM
jgi:hypothetical protein